MFKRLLTIGTKKDNVLTGSDRLDILLGRAGNDILHGLGGKDFLFGGKGDDKLFGGDGDDFLFGDKGNDKLFGGDGNDKLFGGKGDDYLNGGAGSDYLFGDKGNDTFNFNWSDNVGAKNYYDGGKGLDTLKLTLTFGEWELAKQEIEEFKGFLGSSKAYHFDSLGLTVRDFEAVVVNKVNTAPTALGDINTEIDENSLLEISAEDVLGNHTDPDRFDVLTTVPAEFVTALGAKVVVKADGSIAYDPREATDLQALGDGDFEIDSFSYTVKDLAGATSTVTVNVKVTGLDDEPTGPKELHVAVVGNNGSVNSAVAAQLADSTSTVFKFTNIKSISVASTTDWTTELAGIDVVVIGDDGLPPTEMSDSGLLSALSEFITNGHGVVTTGLFASFALPGAEAISPIINPQAGTGLKFVSPGQPIAVRPQDDAGKFIAGQNDAFSYDVVNFHEYAAVRDGIVALDANAQVLAADTTGNIFIAYDQAGTQEGGGRTVYLGSPYMHLGGGAEAEGSRLPGSTLDELFERAVAWAGGVGPDYDILG